MRGYARDGVVEKIRRAGGEVYAITSEPQALATRAREDWEVRFETVGDPHHEIAASCRERGWLDLFVNEKVGMLRSSAEFEVQHPKGYFQPGVLALDASGRVLYRWRSVPTRKNMGGAAERPTADHAWAAVERALAAPEDAADAPLDRDPRLDRRGLPWPLFVSLLVANGWFLRPRGFTYQRGGRPVQLRLLRALARLALFVAAWVAAFAWLPTGWVVAALALWAAWIIPPIRGLHVAFQNERDPDVAGASTA